MSPSIFVDLYIGSRGMAISEWPKDQRPRERLLATGPESLSDPELIAILLRTGIAGKNAIELGREILSHFGSLNRLFAASSDELAKLKGLGPAKLAIFQTVIELARRAIFEELKAGPVLRSSPAVKHFLHLQFANQEQEIFLVLFLDVQHRLIASEKMFEGTLTRTHVYPREILRRALTHNAAAVIFAHNHPSGVAEPSGLDKSMTADLKRVMQSMDITLLDHIIVGAGKTWSFSEHGLC
jgi:DNA repair protein RadC